MKHIIFIGLMIILLLIIFSNHAFAGDLTYTERGKYTVKCFVEDKANLYCFKRPIEKFVPNQTDTKKMFDSRSKKKTNRKSVKNGLF